MKAESRESFNKLVASLDQLVKLYRGLLNIIRSERELLIKADLDELNKNNLTKEDMLVQVRQVETERIRCSEELAKSEGLSLESPRLQNFANHLQGEAGEKLRSLHSVLELLLNRVRDLNKQNEVLVNSALENINGAMNSIRDTLTDKPTYKKGGQVDGSQGRGGQLVSREV